MAYKTRDEVLDLIGSSGQYWSDEDKALAARDPDAGMSIYNAKKDYLSAKDDAGRKAANNRAESIRKQYGGYTAGKAGDSFTKDGTYFNYQDPYVDQMNAVLDKLLDYGEFENPYQSQIDQTLDKITGRDPFAYNAADDPIFQQYRDTYLREGQRANEDTMGNYAMMTGGQPSTAAVNAASQTQDYYNAQLSDKIPELYQLAYQMYSNEGNDLMNQLSAVRGLAQDALSTWGANLGLAQSQMDAIQGLSDIGYNRAFNKWNSDYQIGRDKVSDRQWDQQFRLTAQERAQQIAIQMIQAGVTPSHALIVAAGMNDADASAAAGRFDEQYQLDKQMQELQLNQMRRAGSGSSGRPSGGGSRSRSSGSGGRQDYTGLFRAAYASGHPKSFIANNYKNYGFTSSSGLYSDFEEWDPNSETTSEKISRLQSQYEAAKTKGDRRAAAAYKSEIEDLRNGINRYG